MAFGRTLLYSQGLPDQEVREITARNAPLPKYQCVFAPPNYGLLKTPNQVFHHGSSLILVIFAISSKVFFSVQVSIFKLCLGIANNQRWLLWRGRCGM